MEDVTTFVSGRIEEVEVSVDNESVPATDRKQDALVQAEKILVSILDGDLTRTQQKKGLQEIDRIVRDQLAEFDEQAS